MAPQKPPTHIHTHPHPHNHPPIYQQTTQGPHTPHTHPYTPPPPPIQNVMTSFKEPLIHTFNKNERACFGTSYFEAQITSRNNIILVGDSLGDLTMADGAKGVENLLKIGYLNDKVSTLVLLFAESLHE